MGMTSHFKALSHPYPRTSVTMVLKGLKFPQDLNTEDGNNSKGLSTNEMVAPEKQHLRVTSTCTHVQPHTSVHTYPHAHDYTCSSTHTCLYTLIHTYAYTHLSIHICLYTFIYTHTRLRIYMPVSTHLYTHLYTLIYTHS